MDRPHPPEASGIPFRWEGVTVRGDAVAPHYGLPKPDEGEPDLPANAQLFQARPAAQAATDSQTSP